MKKPIYDVVVGGGSILDVITGKKFRGYLGIEGDKIACISRSVLHGKKYENAEGKIVAPGFIDFHSHVDGNPFSAECMVRQGGTTTLGGERFLSGKRVRDISRHGFIINQGFSVSASFVLRQAVGLRDPRRPASREEIRVMADMADRFLAAGAFAISFALEFVPGTSYQEMEALGRVAKNYDRPLLIHLRKDGVEGLQYFEEIFRVARATGVKIHFVQLQYMVGIGGAMPRALAMMDAAREEGLDVTADTVLYDAYCASIGTEIFAPGWEEQYGNCSCQDLMIASGIYAGQFCTEELFCELRKNHPATLVMAFVCDEEAIPMALQKEYIYVSTNAADGPHYPGIGAPEVAGTFPRLLGKYVRQERVLSMIDAVRKVTILPAGRFGLKCIGALREGYQADLVILDEKKILDKAEYMGIGSPDAPPKGIQAVYVNGRRVVSHGRLTEECHAGRWKSR